MCLKSYNLIFATVKDQKDKSLADLDNLPDPDVLANDIIENLEAAVGSFKEIMAAINGKEG